MGPGGATRVILRPRPTGLSLRGISSAVSGSRQSRKFGPPGQAIVARLNSSNPVLACQPVVETRSRAAAVSPRSSADCREDIFDEGFFAGRRRDLRPSLTAVAGWPVNAGHNAGYTAGDPAHPRRTAYDGSPNWAPHGIAAHGVRDRRGAGVIAGLAARNQTDIDVGHGDWWSCGRRSRRRGECRNALCRDGPDGVWYRHHAAGASHARARMVAHAGWPGDGCLHQWNAGGDDAWPRAHPSAGAAPPRP